MKEIEQGTKREFIDTIRDPAEIWKLVLGLIQSATEELVILFSTAANVIRNGQDYKELIDLLRKASERNVIVRILADEDDPINNMIESLREDARKDLISNNLQIRSKPRATNVTIIVADNSYSLTVEVKDAAATIIDDAIGLATYSNSEPTVSSYISIFETLWVQIELYKQKKEN
jgi:phosphatidylserine/phosphatidylglycerophosphate/cardiolipin synthase-like enzyme